MKVNVPSGQIQNGSIYEVSGVGTVTYGGTPYIAGQQFTGTTTTTYTESGTPDVYQILVAQGLTVEEIIRIDDIVFQERVKIFSIEVEEIIQNTFSDKVNLFGVTIEEHIDFGGQIIWMI